MKYIIALIVSIGLMGFSHTTLYGGDVTEISRNSNVALAHVVYYHLHHWRVKHFVGHHGHDEAHHFEHTMRHLGCRTIMTQDGLHVYYKCEHEKVASFHNHHDADHFRQQMKRLGFIVR